MKSIFNAISFDNLRGDLFGGVTAAIVSLPLALAFGVASGAGAEAGLYGAIFVGLFAALFGGTPTLISEPTGPMTVVMTAVLTSLIAANPEHGLAMAFTVVMIAGAFQISLGLFKLGRYITLMPYSVISGFMTGIGLILIILQMAPLLGHSNPGGGVVGSLTAFPEMFANARPFEVILGVATLLLLFLFPKAWGRLVPPQLVALIFGSLAAVVLLSEQDIRSIGAISMGLPSINWPTFTQEQIGEMLVDGVVLGTLGCIDALLTAMIADSLTRQEHKSNKELVGQGIGNMVSGITRALILFITVFFAAGLTAYIPLAVLAAIAIKVGLNILDWSFLQRAHRVSLRAAMVMYGVMLLTVFVDLIVAVGIGVFIANILTIERLSQVQAKNIQSVSDTDDQIPLAVAERGLLERGKGKVMLLYFSGPMIFGVSSAIAKQQANIDGYKRVVFDLTDVPMIDATVSLAIENAIKNAIDTGKEAYLVCPSAETARVFSRMGLLEVVSGNKAFSSRYDALLAAVNANGNQHCSPLAEGEHVA